MRGCAASRRRHDAVHYGNNLFALIILGINAFHADSSAALVQDGKLIATAEEERFRRIKHWAGFPSEAIAYCLREARMQLSDVEHIAFNQDNRANLLRKILYLVTKSPDIKLVLSRLRNRRARMDIPCLLEQTFPGKTFRRQLQPVEHHLAHLASAFHICQFEQAAVASVDGFGDFASAAWGVGTDCEISTHGRVYFPHSLGIFYQALTQYLGFPHYGDEYKVMGLAPYGRPSFLNALSKRPVMQVAPSGRRTRFGTNPAASAPLSWTMRIGDRRSAPQGHKAHSDASVGPLCRRVYNRGDCR